jgi:hypothetical protein
MSVNALPVLAPALVVVRTDSKRAPQPADLAGEKAAQQLARVTKVSDKTICPRRHDPAPDTKADYGLNHFRTSGKRCELEVLRSRGFLGVRFAASGIEEPSLESRTRLVRKRLVKRYVILGGSRRASGAFCF